MNIHVSARTLDYQTLGTLAYTYGGAEPGEVLAIAAGFVAE
ncbi:hypothetical protein [Halalkalicoccus subterraneus]|nr:hypothetical protein [Halalkalicoccus subterraneus]